VASAPGSMKPIVKTPASGYWELGWPGNRDFSEHDFELGEEVTNPHPRVPVFHMGDSCIMLKDFNKKSYDWYWVRRNFLHYQQILSSMNCLTNHLFGQSPEQWSYTDLAAPFFLKENPNQGQ